MPQLRVPEPAHRHPTLGQCWNLWNFVVKGRISPHSLRHTFATIALDTGTSLRALQDSMGHADPRTTRRYDRARNNLTKSASYDVARAVA